MSEPRPPNWTLPDPILSAFCSALAGDNAALCAEGVFGPPEFRGAKVVPRTGRFVHISAGTKYTFSPAIVRHCISKGIQRNQRNIGVGSQNRKRTGHRSNEDIIIQGVLGEYAFCALFGLVCSIDDTRPRNARRETGFDAVLDAEGWTVDVKTTVPFLDPRRRRPLIAHVAKSENAPSVFALMVYVNYDPRLSLFDNLKTPPVMQFCGFASSRKVFARHGCFSNAYQRSLAEHRGNEWKADYGCQVDATALVDRLGLWREHKRTGRLMYVYGDDGDETCADPVDEYQ